MDYKDGQGDNAPRANEWEVVSLTSSAYAAAPGPVNVETMDARKYDAYYEAGTSNALFMSDHFVFPPSEHENLPIETFFAETKGSDLPAELPRTWSRGESTLGSARSETVGGVANELLYVESNETPEGALDLHLDASSPLRPAKDAKDGAYNLPCEAWWRRRAGSVYAHAKEANAFWSLFVAAAVTGLVILGHSWQQERWQVLYLKWQSSIGSEKLSRIIGPLARFKELILGGNRQASFLGTGSLSEL